MDNIVLSQLKESFDREEEKLKILQKKEEEMFWKTKGFKTWEEIVSYLKKTNKTLYNYGDTLKWNSDKNMIEHHYQCSDGYDCNFWYETKFLSEDEFINHHKSLDEKYSDICRNTYGYIYDWTK